MQNLFVQSKGRRSNALTKNLEEQDGQSGSWRATCWCSLGMRGQYWNHWKQ